MIRVYDIETFSNCFTYTDVDPETREIKTFVISDFQDDFDAFCEYIEYLRMNKAGMVGLNNVHFDWPVVYEIVNQRLDTGFAIYRFVQNELISEKNKFEQERPRDTPQIIPQLDLYLLNHYDNKGRNTSLKALQVSLHWDNVMDNPFHHSRYITRDELAMVLEYNLNDVLFTEYFYNKCKEKVEFRKKIYKEYRLNVMNSSDVGIGEAIFMQQLTRTMRTSAYNLKQLVTKEVDVSLESIIFPYIEFKDPRFQELLRLIKKTRASSNFIQTFIENIPKGISVNDLHDMMKANNMPVRQYAQSKKSFSFTRNYGGMLIEYGVGGIHGCVPPGIFRKSETQTILDIDVKSYYPNLFIRNGVAPRHINKEVFLRVYEETFDSRVVAQKQGNKLISDALKLALNGVFGKTGSKTSPIYDPRAFYAITVNGQLLLTMLTEWLHTAGAKLLQVNTDGVTILVDNDKLPEIYNLCKMWEQKTKLTLEYAQYEAMYIRDVNNYFAVKEDGKVKAKGVFSAPGLSKNPQNTICTEAVTAYITRGTELQHTICSCRDIRKFITLRTVNGGAIKGDVPLGRAIRWYYSVQEHGQTINYVTNGNTVPRSEGARPIMDLPDAIPPDLNFRWYIEEAEEILRSIGALPRPVVEKLPRKNSKAWKELRDTGKIVENHKGEWVWAKREMEDAV